MIRALWLSLMIGIFSSTSGAAKVGLCEQHLSSASKRYGVPLAVLYAVGLTESGRNGVLHPYALNLEGEPLFPENQSQAIAAFEKARERGLKLIDIGCMQINFHFHGNNFASIKAMLDPKQNVDYAASFLSELKARGGNWTAAVARYHAGAANLPAQKAYTCRVIGNLVASGVGAWTENARAYCQP